MPMKPIQVKANFQLDTSAARAQLQGLQRELSSITKNSSAQLGVTQQITEAIKAAELLKQTLSEATNINTGTLDLTKFTTSMRENMTSIEQMKKSLQSLGPEGEKAFNSLAMNIATAQVPLQRTSELFGQFKTAISNAMKWQISSMAIHKVTNEISKAFNYAKNLDKSLTNIQIVTGHNADYMAKFAQNANKAAQALSASTLEYTNASLIYYQQGLGDKEVAKRAETTLKLAKVTGESASKVSQQMTAVWNNFSNGVDNLERYADVMTALGATTASSSSEIAKGLEKFASVTKTIGLSYDYAASALATVTAQTRQSADSVGTAFKTLFSRLESLNLGETLDDSVTLNKYSEALLKVGVNVMDVNGHLKNMDSILDELGGRWDHLNKAQQVALAQTVGGVRNYTSLITLMDNWEDFQTNLITSQLAEGTLQKQADIYAKSWEAAQQRVTTAAQGIYDTLISSDFFKGINNITAFALNGINGMGRALGTGGSLAGLSMLINSAYKENLTTGINNLGNNILANTAYGQRQAINVKNDMLQQLNKDLTFNDSSLNIFRESLLKSATTVNDNFTKNYKTLPTKALQQTYSNLLATTNGEAIQALNQLANIDQWKTIDSRILRGETIQSILNESRAGHAIDSTEASNFLSKIERREISNGLVKNFSNLFNRDILAAVKNPTTGESDPKVVSALQEKVDTFIKGNFQGFTGTKDFVTTGEAGRVVNNTFSDVLNDIAQGNITENTVSALNGLLEEASKVSGEKSAELVNDFVKNEMKYDLTSEEGKAAVTRMTQLAADYRTSYAQGLGQEYAGRYKAEEIREKYEKLNNASYLQKMSQSRNGLLSIKTHTEKNALGQNEEVENSMTMGAFTVQTAQMVNSLAMATNSIHNFRTSIQNGDVTFSNFAATLGSTGLAIGQTLNFMHNNSALIGFMGGKAGTAIAGKLGKIPGVGSAFQTKEGGLSSLGGGLIAAAAAATIYAGIKGYEIYKANTIDSKISRANEDKIQLNSLAKNDKQKYDAFLDVAKTQNENYGKLFSLQQNTTQYTSQLIESNQQARDLIDTYNLKAGTDFNIDQQGAIYFSAKQIADISERLLDQSLESSGLAQLANSKITQLDAIKNNAYGMRTVSKTKVSGGETVGGGLGVGAVTVEQKSDEEYQAELKEAEQHQKEQSALAQADYQVALQTVINSDKQVTDFEQLAADILGSKVENAEGYAKELYEVAKAGGITRGITGEYLDEASLRNIYMQDEYFGEAADANMTQQELAAAIEAKAAQNILEKQIASLSNLDASAVSKYANYSRMNIIDLNQLIQSTQNDTNYDSLNLLALNKIASSQDSLAQALFNNTNISDLNFQTLAGNMQEQLKLSVEQSTNLANYINNFGTNFGDATGQAILTALTGYNAETGAFGTGFNSEFYKELQNISTSSSIASLADLEQRIGMTGNRALADSMRDLQKAMMADINDRGGLAKTLFESSDFQDTFTKLQEVFQSTGSITAQNIADLAAKNETLNGYLQATASQTPMSGTQAVADIASLLASGAITTSDLNPAIAAFINEASGTGKGSQQEAVNEAEEARKGLSDSITDADKFYQEGGKIWYNAIKNDALLDAPMQEWFNQVLKPKDLDKINRIFTLGVGKDTNWMVNQIKSTMPEVYKMMTELQGGSGKRAGKGGGGLDTYLGYLGADDFLAQSGIKIEENGRITFPGIKEGQTFEQLYDEYMDTIHPEEQTHYMTENGMYEFVTHYLQTQGHMPAAQASFIATQFVGRSASSSLGTVYARNGILAGQDKLLKELGSGKTGAITGDALDALYELYGLGMSGLTIDEKTGQLRALTEEELKNNVSGLTGDQFRNYIATQARLQGSAIIDTNGLAESGVDTTTELVGNALRDRSYGTISGTGVGAIVDAALKYGVTAYDMQQTLPNGETFKDGLAFDYKELQDFYTNILHLPIETFNQHLPELMGELRSYSGLEGGHTGLNYQYKDIFGATHNISSTDAKYWKDDGTFDAEKYANDVAESERDNEWDEYQNQRMMQEAYDNWHTAMREDGSTFGSAKEYYDYLVAEEQYRREQQAAENGVIGAEHAGAITQSQKVNELKTKYGYTDEDIRQILASPNAEQAVNEAYEQASTKEQREAEAQAAQQAEQEAQLAQQQADRDYITQNAAAYDAWINAGGSGNIEDFKTWKTKQEDIAKEQNDKVKKEAEAKANQTDADLEYQADLNRIAEEEAAAAEAARRANAQKVNDELIAAEQNERDAAAILSSEEAAAYLDADETGDRWRKFNGQTNGISIIDFVKQLQAEEAAAQEEQAVPPEEENQVNQTEVETQAQAITQAMQQQSFSTFGEILANNQLYDVSGITGYNMANITTEEQDTLKRLQADADAYANMSDKERREAGLSKAELTQYQQNSQEAADLYKYQNMMSPEQRMAEINKALDIYNGGKGEGQLTPFQKFLMNSIGEIVDYQGIMADATEEGDEATRKAKQAQVNEEGELVDEEGNPIELPQNQQPSGGGGGGGDSGEDTGTGGGPSGPSKPKGPFGDTYIDPKTGGTYVWNPDAKNDQGGVGGYEPSAPPMAVQDEKPSAGGCFAPGTQISMSDGTYKNIENVKVGDFVIAYDEITQKFVSKRVTSSQPHYNTPKLVQLTFNNGIILQLTPGHPLYSNSGWKSLDPQNSLYEHETMTSLMQLNDSILSIYNLINIIDIQYLNIGKNYTSYNITVEDCHTFLANGFVAHNSVSKSASGQNNARLLAYASGKEGHIAITGELGPELRVKSDGSMDILGKTGREYAWVEPDDRIYTASQSAGILKSNKIPGLEGLAKGINNFLPGYSGGVVLDGSTASDQGSSSSGGGGGGGGGRGGGGAAEEIDPRYDPNTLKIRDILERYYTILQKIDDITRAVERFAKVADRAWGQDRIKAIEKQTDLYQQQYDAQKQYVKQIGEYMNTDENALTTMIREFVEGWNKSVDENQDPNNTMEKISWTGAQFDSNGVLTNYRDFVEKLTEQYNANAQANSMDKNAQYKFQEQLKDIQMYTDTLNLWESETDKLQDLANQILDNSLKEITYRVEYELELNADQKRLLDFRDSFVKDDIFKVAEHISNMNKEIANTADSLEKTRQGLYDYLGTLAGENMRVGQEYDDVALGIATRDEQGLVSEKKYSDIDFKQVSNNLDTWLAELRKKDAEGAAEVDKIIQRDGNGLITNYRDVLNKINEMNGKLSNDSIQKLLTNTEEFFNSMADLTNNPKWTGLSTEMKDQITNYMDQFIQYIESMGSEFKEIIESMGDSIKAFGKKMDAEIDEFDYYGDVYKSFGNIIDLTNQKMTDITADFFKTLNSKILDNNINKLEANRKKYELFSGTLAQVRGQYEAMVKRMEQASTAEEKAFYQQRVDELKDQLDIANNQMENAHKDFLQSWEDALSKIQENYKQAVEQASKEFEKGFSPLFSTLALLQAQFDREKALGDLYVDNYQRIHDLNKLNRDIDQSILDTDNLKSKQKLRDLQQEIKDLQEDGTELSEYDLDILDKKYKLELARQALEDAKDAKSVVRLSRDNNGNWGYVYTADEDEVAKAEQDYEDAIRDMEQANQDYIDNIQDQIINVQQEAQQAILALQPEDFATYDDYLAAVQNIQDAMYQTLNFLRSQMNNAFDNNDWLENYVPGIVRDHGLTDNFGDTTLAGLLLNNDLDDAIERAKENLQDNLITPALESFATYSEKQKEVYETAGHNMATIGQEFGKEMNTLTKQSEEQVQVVEDLSKRVEKSFTDTMNSVTKATDDWLNKIEKLITEYDKLLAAVTELKRIDGEYVEPAKLINADNAVDSWKEISDFERALTANGVLNLVTTDEKTGKERVTKFIAGTQTANDFIRNATIGAAKKDIIDVGEDVDEAEDKKVRDYIKQRGLVWVKYKDSEGEHEIMFNSEEEWAAWYEKHKYVAPVDTGGGSSGGDDSWWWGAEAHNSGATGYDYRSGDTGGYTGRWQSADTGMYTGEWPSGSVRRNGRLAWLHQKELILNAHDTENFLDAMEIVRQLDNLTNWMANGLGDLIMPKVTTESGELEQNVHIEAEFPNVTDHNEIEQAFNNLVNMASQYANRK